MIGVRAWSLYDTVINHAREAKLSVVGVARPGAVVRLHQSRA